MFEFKRNVYLKIRVIRNISLISDFKLSIEKYCEYKKLCRIKHFLFANILETKITFVLILIRI